MYGDDLDEEDDSVASGSPHAAQEDDLLTQLLQGAGSVDAPTLASLEMIRLIRDMRDEERRRRADEGNDLDIFGGSSLASTSMGKALAGMTSHRARTKEHPRRVTDKFRLEAKEELNVKVGEAAPSTRTKQSPSIATTEIRSSCSSSRSRPSTWSAASQQHGPMTLSQCSPRAAQCRASAS